MFLLLTLLSLCQQDGVAPVTAKPSRPNILYILADDLGYADVSWNNPFMKTPNLEALARKGVILDQFYTQVKIWQVLWVNMFPRRDIGGGGGGSEFEVLELTHTLPLSPKYFPEM